MRIRCFNNFYHVPFIGNLSEDIKESSKWIVKAFAADKLILDYTIGSFINIDRFFNKHVVNGEAKKGGRFDKGVGTVLFAISAYVSETFIKTVKGTVLLTDDDALDGELTVSIEFPDGSIIWPTQRVMKRFKNGNEDSIYVYGHSVTEAFTKDEFDVFYWDAVKEKKAWWKFW